LLISGRVLKKKGPALLGELRIPGAANDLAVVLDLKHGHLAGQTLGHRAEPQDTVAGHEPFAAVDGTVRPLLGAVEERHGVDLRTVNQGIANGLDR